MIDDAFRAKAVLIEDQIGRIQDAMSGRGPWPAELVDPELVARVTKVDEIEIEPAPVTAEEIAYVKALIRQGEKPR